MGLYFYNCVNGPTIRVVCRVSTLLYEIPLVNSFIGPSALRARWETLGCGQTAKQTKIPMWFFYGAATQKQAFLDPSRTMGPHPL